MVVFQQCGSVLVLCLVHLLKCTAPASLSNTKILNFEDKWNHKIPPHNMPLMEGSTRNHILPATFEYEKDLRVYDLANNNAKNNTRASNDHVDVVRTRVPCGVCKLGVGLLQKEVVAGTPFEEIKTKFVSLCVSFKIESELVCSGFFDVFGPEVVAVVKASQLTPSEICSMIFGETCGKIENPLHDWKLDIPYRTKKEANNNEIKKERLKIFKVLHLSDTHLDPEYAIGTPANCEEPLCCRNYSTPSTNSTIFSGRWGAYDKCDSPRNLIENMLEHIAMEHSDIDYIIWTGDLPPHDIWNQSKQSNIDIIVESVQQMFLFFPDTPIFPAIGNHESVPSGSFAPPWMTVENHSISWLYKILADQWRIWLPSTSDKTVLHGGFYSVLLRPGFRLISLNTNYCHTLSWWLLVNSTDPANELKWLIHELQKAEDNGEKVHLIGHIAPGSADCMKTWSKNFYAIVERYETIIAAQFYGHSHADEFEIFYETQNYSKPTSVAYLGPSISTYENFNPAYRIYYVDGDYENSTLEVLDHDTWTMDLEKANDGDNKPVWYKLYTAKDTYAMESLKPVEWDKLVKRMMNDTDLFELFYRNYYRDSPVRPFCDSQCKLQILCDLKCGRSHDRHQLCHDLEYL